MQIFMLISNPLKTLTKVYENDINKKWWTNLVFPLLLLLSKVLACKLLAIYLENFLVNFKSAFEKF
jgi:hypothetical protein